MHIRDFAITVINDAAPLLLELDQITDIEPVRVVDRAL